MSNTINIVDIGAAGGLDDLFLPIIKFQKSNVYLFEPNRKEFNNLKQKYCEDKSVKVFDYAISNTVSKRNFFNLPSDLSTCSSLKYRELFDKNKTTKSSVQTQTIDNLVKKKIIETPDIIKLDVEGSENDILRGMKKTLNSGAICLKTEFCFQGDESNDVYGNGFSSINKIMLENNFMLVGLCYYDTLTCHVWGGDLLYLKNPEDQIFKEDNQKYFKLINICYILNKMNFVKKTFQSYKKRFNSEENKIIQKYLDDYSLFGKKQFYFPRLSKLFFFFSLFFMGPFYTCKSAPKVNQLNGLNKGFKKSFSENKLL